MSDLSQLRNDMVENQIAARNIRSEAVLGALRKVPRELRRASALNFVA